MTTVEFLNDLRRRGIQLSAEGGMLRCRAPRGALTPDIRSELAGRKNDILKLLVEVTRATGAIDPIARISRDGDLPLSFIQERLWFLHQMEPASTAYNIVAAVRFRTPLDLAAVEQTLTEIVRRHEVLRTTFVSRDGQPFARITAPAPVRVPVVDLRDRPAAERTRELERLKDGEARRPFDLESGPLLRVSVLQADDRDWEILLAQHHIVSDRWSLGVLMAEVQTLYGDFSSGRGSSLPDLPVQYVDFAHWQRERMSGELLDAQLAYWREQLGGELPILDLPTDRPRPNEPTFNGTWESRALSAALAAHVRSLCRQDRVTPFMVFIAAFSVLLQKYSGQDDVLIGSPMAGRTTPSVEPLIGCFVNSVVLRTDLSGNPSFRDVLTRVRATALGAYSHAEMPFEKLVAELQRRRDLSRTPLFQVSLAFQSAPKSAQVPSTVTTTTSAGALFDLTFFVVETADSYLITAEYNTDLFDQTTIERMLAHFERLLEAAVAQLDAPIAALSLLSETENAEIVGRNQTALEIGSAACVSQWVEAQAAATPGAIAVEFENRRWTYEELNARANRLAHYLRAAGVGPDTLVGVCLERAPEMLAVLLGVLKAGGAYLPLDPSYPPARLQFMLDDAGVTIVMADESLADLAPFEGRRVITFDTALSASAAADASNPSPRATGDNLAYIIYTSGSTGTPKGVEVGRRALVNLLVSMREALQPEADARLLSVTTLAFDIAGLELFLPLIVGARVVIVSRDVASDGRALIAALSESSATMMQATPATWRLLLEDGWAPPREFRILCGGEALPADLAARLAECGETWNLYGPTEATIWSSAERVGAKGRPVTIGRPIGNTQMYILDRSLRPQPVGLVGELYIGGDGLARGYHQRAALTAERFLPNPFAERAGQRLYRTGDLARFLADGRIEWIDRVDQQVKVRGFRIELREIEAALAGHPAVQQAVVFVDGDTADRRLVAHVVFHSGESLTASELRRHARQTLPPHMIPSFFVKVDNIPLMLNGKIDRRALSEPFAAGADAARIAPRTAVEIEIAAIWQRLLGIDAVGIHDNFFDIGGHSLLSMRVLAEIERTRGRRLNPRVMFLENLEQIAARFDHGEDARSLVDHARTLAQAGARS